MTVIIRAKNVLTYQASENNVEMISLVIEIRTILFFGSNISVSNCNLALNDVLWFPPPIKLTMTI